jgi:hypothetical protein
MAEALDGNAIGGLLMDVFRAEMTTAHTTCPGCGAGAMLAETSVYLRSPGTVVRCRTCSSVLMVLVSVHGITCVDCHGLDTSGAAQ